MITYLWENLGFPILSNFIAPIVLFVSAYFFMKIPYLDKLIVKIYRNVIRELQITNEITDSNMANAPSQRSKSFNSINNSNNHSSDILQKESKNYGDFKGWDITTFYLVTKHQINDYEAINFKIKKPKFSIILKTNDIKNYFKLNNVVDGADRIRIYIYRDKYTRQFYLVRFGKNILKTPYLLKKINNKNEYKLIKNP